MMYHVNDDGDVKRCRAEKQQCRFAIHGESMEAAEAQFVESRNLDLFGKPKQPKGVSEFSSDSYYGHQSPRGIQVQPLNDVMNALNEEDATQLVAACGTGKTYMHRQLLRKFMDRPDANGVSVLLTSSIRLAHDTANDLRPTGGYDESLGTFGVDYEVIEVHSDARPSEGRQAVRSEGVINVDRIYDQMKNAREQGKKIVIVSTYDSVGKVQEAQARFDASDRMEADLLIHDEAHNILGQQRPTTVASDENELTAYVGFHNSIPGSVQARKRLYSTATPVMRESESDKAAIRDVNEAIEAAQRMRAGDQKERVTVYSDNELVGKVSGFISQNEAIENACLAKPLYEIRESSVKGNLDDFKEPVISPNGTIIEKTISLSRYPMSHKTYAALSSTLDALVEDPDDDSVNSSHNVLVYAGSITQAEGFKESFAEAALSRSGGLSLEEASELSESPDIELRRKARFRLLAEHAQVKAAHSRTDSDAVRERREAFQMFHGHAATSNKWTPHKNVLSNVDIFSEGVSIPEIDTVVISDDSKLNEKSMTQAIGRAIRVVPNNDHKKFGRVIVPSVNDSTGTSLNSSSVNMAAYISTRVERGSTASKLRGDVVRADDVTTFTSYGPNGVRQRDVRARELAVNAVDSFEDLAVSTEMKSSHQYLMKNDPSYVSLSPAERFQVRKSRVQEKLDSLSEDSPRRAYLETVSRAIQGKTLREVKSIEQNGRVVSSALATGDVSSLSPKLAASFLEHGVLRPKSGGSGREFTVDEKRSFLREHRTEFSYSLLTSPKDMTDDHREVNERLSDGWDRKSKMSFMREGMASIRGGRETSGFAPLSQKYDSLLKDDAFVDRAFEVLGRNSNQLPPAITISKNKGKILSSIDKVHSDLLSRAHASAEAGEEVYELDSTAVRKTGEITVAKLREMISRSLIR